MAGISATSNVFAGTTYGIPLAGTVAHSFIEAFQSERKLSRPSREIYPATTLLVDTYDTLEGVRRSCPRKFARKKSFRWRACGWIPAISSNFPWMRERSSIMPDCAMCKSLRAADLDETEIDRLVTTGRPSMPSAWEPS